MPREADPNSLRSQKKRRIEMRKAEALVQQQIKEAQAVSSQAELLKAELDRIRAERDAEREQFQRTIELQNQTLSALQSRIIEPEAIREAHPDNEQVSVLNSEPEYSTDTAQDNADSQEDILRSELRNMLKSKPQNGTDNVTNYVIADNGVDTILVGLNSVKEEAFRDPVVSEVINAHTEDLGDDFRAESPEEEEARKRAEAKSAGSGAGTGGFFSGAQTGEEGKTKFNLNGSKLADWLMIGGEMVRKDFYPYLYKMTNFDDKERHLLDVMQGRDILDDRQKAYVNTVFEEEEIAFMPKYSAYKAYIDSMPMSPDQKELIRVPLEELLKDSNITMGPGAALVMSTGIVFGLPLLPILGPLLGRLLEKIMNPQQEENGQDQQPAGV